MKRRTVRGDPGVERYRHRETSLRSLTRLFCTCGALMYEGPEPDFAAVSCPSCRKVHEMRRPTGGF